MKVLLQRVRRAEVRVEGQAVGSIGAGLLVFIGVERGDGPEEVEAYAAKTAELRIFGDGAGRMNLDVRQAGGAILVVSQFTLAGSTRRGLRPSFDGAAEPGRANELYLAYVGALRARGLSVETGVFGAMMEVELVNDGPVTFLL
ncbi:MAG TPA: D-aminoacyl-tRNA deacylase [Candidatus Polarisedimenticolaceae bacterium]|nr:D-aminoacyl-tRNA deacylase [Candidatus Polarisedimenticolaceae bacterium]